ncbi:hypothetical protein Val02_29890 [Virgisporangium aliadipatigenens]|uniref:ABM domain-containing protein n=1 Tax=Virgisporangium aliadipatigenens TaxID=741659 RepID=A0A8J3YLS8_9ACTN|nr:putative quinol monooxygenase [Virgisporangium aliadipatigenens]GIJ46103.1 hypothetical protein Val02_29890 [Virgisporangium aliadipatigenens]
MNGHLTMNGDLTMPVDDSDVREALNQLSLPVDPDDSRPRPMIAILDARPGMTSQLREKVVELVRQVRREPGCLEFTAYQARDTRERFYLYEVYASTAAFVEHLRTQHVHDFVTAASDLCTAQSEGVVQLDEIAID